MNSSLNGLYALRLNILKSRLIDVIKKECRPFPYDYRYLLLLLYSNKNDDERILSMYTDEELDLMADILYKNIFGLNIEELNLYDKGSLFNNETDKIVYRKINNEYNKRF